MQNSYIQYIILTLKKLIFFKKIVYNKILNIIQIDIYKLNQIFSIRMLKINLMKNIILIFLKKNNKN